MTESKTFWDELYALGLDSWEVDLMISTHEATKENLRQIARHSAYQNYVFGERWKDVTPDVEDLSEKLDEWTGDLALDFEDKIDNFVKDKLESRGISYWEAYETVGQMVSDASAQKFFQADYYKDVDIIREKVESIVTPDEKITQQLGKNVQGGDTLADRVANDLRRFEDE